MSFEGYLRSVVIMDYQEFRWPSEAVDGFVSTLSQFNVHFAAKRQIPSYGLVQDPYSQLRPRSLSSNLLRICLFHKAIFTTNEIHSISTIRQCHKPPRYQICLPFSIYTPSYLPTPNQQPYSPQHQPCHHSSSQTIHTPGSAALQHLQHRHYQDPDYTLKLASRSLRALTSFRKQSHRQRP